MQRVWFLSLLCWLSGCDTVRAPSNKHLFNRDEPVFRGACDASGAVALSAERFAVADDEDNVLRVYDAARPGMPVSSVDLSPALGLIGKKGAREADLEAATRLGDRALWLSSHGRNSRGKYQPERLRFFATDAPADGKPLRLLGEPYTGLLDDMLRAPQLARFGLEAAAALPPKSPGGLNIEGLSATLDGKSVWIGFRNPIPEGRALLVPLLNPQDVLITHAAPRFGEPALLDLGGLGVRAISMWRGQHVIVAGPPAAASGKRAKLFLWDGVNPPRAAEADLGEFNPEAIVGFEQRERLLLLSDDGEENRGQERCKDLLDPARKRFRGRWISAGPR